MVARAVVNRIAVSRFCQRVSACGLKVEQRVPVQLIRAGMGWFRIWLWGTWLWITPRIRCIRVSKMVNMDGVERSSRGLICTAHRCPLCEGVRSKFKLMKHSVCG